MARESLASKRERAAAIEERMFEHYGPGKASLDYRTPFELTVAWCCRPSVPTPP